jgi:hypothetical protein
MNPARSIAKFNDGLLVGAQDPCAPIQQGRSIVAVSPFVFSAYSVRSVVNLRSLCGRNRSARIESANAS